MIALLVSLTIRRGRRGLQVICESDPGRYIDDVRRVLPQMREQLGGTGNGKPDDP
jgi:hypothetical protein